MQKRKVAIALALLLSATACSPQRLQSARLTDYKNGQPFYSMTGYTDLGDTAPKASVKYVEYSLSDACPAGVKIDSLHEYDSHNGLGHFLYWEAVAGCK